MIAAQLLGGALTHGDLASVRHGVNGFPLGAGHVPVGERVDEMAVCHQATDRRDMLLPLDVGQDRVSTSDQVLRKGQRADRAGRRFVKGRQHHADRNHPAVRQYSALGMMSSSSAPPWPNFLRSTQRFTKTRTQGHEYAAPRN